MTGRIARGAIASIDFVFNLKYVGPNHEGATFGSPFVTRNNAPLSHSSYFFLNLVRLCKVQANHRCLPLTIRNVRGAFQAHPGDIYFLIVLLLSTKIEHF